ncbi:MAG: ribbon-helix-helix protein, CopG family [Vicinamibacteria bacterium]
MPRRETSTVLTLRVPAALDRLIARAARRGRRSKSAVVREALESAFGADAARSDPAREARRQSLLVSGLRSEEETLDFIGHVADGETWK